MFINKIIIINRYIKSFAFSVFNHVPCTMTSSIPISYKTI